MGEAVGNVLPLAIGVAVSPVPIIAIVLMLGTPRARVLLLVLGTKLIGDVVARFSA
jgi:hypothetical protein